MKRFTLLLLLFLASCYGPRIKVPPNEPAGTATKFYNRACLRIDMEDIEGAKHDLEQCLARDPHNKDAQALLDSLR